MEVKDIRKGEVTVMLSSSEVALLCAALGKDLDEFHESEFSTVTGSTASTAEALLDLFGDLYDKAKEG